jgi:hypothetical protein
MEDNNYQVRKAPALRASPTRPDYSVVSVWTISAERLFFARGRRRPT